MRLFVLLPSYNEGRALPFLLKSLYDTLQNMDTDCQVVVINDGSSDDTEAAAKAWEDRINIRVINHSHNMGLGKAVDTGLSYFYQNCGDDDAALIMDADNTHNPELIPMMIKKLGCGYDTAIASRYEKGGCEVGLSYLRRICSRVVNLLLRAVFNIPGVRDYTCGYRAYSSRIIKKAYNTYGGSFVEETGFTCMCEILIKLHYINCSICEVPLVLRYDLKKGASKMKVLKTIKRYFTLIQYIRHYKGILFEQPVLADGKEK